jgi:coenzyme F420-reducing hydrogenase alpha subunit
VQSVLPLASSHPEVVLRALRMKKIANDLCDVFVGRHTHPITMRIGGFCYFPKDSDIIAMRDRLKKELIPDLWETVKLFSTLKFPEFSRKTEYLALSNPKEYAFLEGKITSTEGGQTTIADYKKKINETVVSHSSAKHCHTEKSTYMVGALARFNVNSKQLHPQAKKAADQLGLKAPNYNTYFNSVAQLVECVHMTYDAIDQINKLLKMKIKPALPNVKIRSGRGVGAAEVPRGTLYHEYGCDEKGIINYANCIIPTGQNLANVEADFKKLVPEILDQPKERIALLLEMLVRAYDPCISCSAHFLDVKFV